MLKAFQQYRFKSAFRKIYGSYGGLMYKYSLPLGWMLPDVFHSDLRSFFAY